MRLLVLAPHVIGADEIRAALPNDDLSGTQVLVVTPAQNESAVAFWLSDADEAIADAAGEAEETARALQEAGARARAKVGDDDPLTALHDALATYPADRILVFDDGLASEARERFDVPVTHGHLRT
jgi:hypothetical protein